MADPRTTEQPKSPGPVSSGALRPHPPRARAGAQEAPPSRTAEELGRRDFVWFALAGWILMLGLVVLRFLFPRVLFEPETTVVIGPAEGFRYGVDESFLASDRIWVCREAEGLFAILARCTHLGCTPDYRAADAKFKCPCHGSGFDLRGINYEGPAPIPLLRCHLRRDARGRVVVDKERLYRFEDFDGVAAADEGPLLAV